MICLTRDDKGDLSFPHVDRTTLKSGYDLLDAIIEKNYIIKSNEIPALKVNHTSLYTSYEVEDLIAYLGEDERLVAFQAQKSPRRHLI